MTVRFFSATDLETPAVTADQMREIDRIAVNETGPILPQMMENAGRNLAELAIELLGASWRQAELVVLAGSGGNGGGGVCAARHLANHGARVHLCLAQPERLTEATTLQRKIFRFTAGNESDLDSLSRMKPDLVIDALLGYSLTTAPHGAAAQLIEWANGTGASILALDLPSGLDATTGVSPGVVINAHWTMTLALPKAGLRPERTGALFLADIGIPEGTYRRARIEYRSPFDGCFTIPLRCREQLD